MRIPCPHCGPREVHEFTYVGDATRTRPALDAPQDEWCTYLFARKNPMGLHLEHWHHTAGCRSVIVVQRNTQTHEVVAACFAAPMPAPAGDTVDGDAAPAEAATTPETAK